MTELPVDSYFLDRARAKRGGRIHAYETVDPVRTALVVVDMQDYFLRDGMPSYIPAGRAIVANINRLAAAVRETGGLVVWIQTEAPDDPDDWANRREMTSEAGWARRQQLLARGGGGFGICPECDVHPDDAVAIKIRYSAFIPHPSELDSLLRERAIETMLITGVATSTCCESTARDGSMWGYRTIMVADGNADQTEALHRHTLGKFLINFGDVQTTEQLVERLAVAAGQATPA